MPTVIMDALKDEFTSRRDAADQRQQEHEAEAARLDAEFEMRLAAAQRRLVALGLEDIFEVDGGHGRGGWGRPRHVYFEIAKHGSRAERKGEEITLEILDRLEALAARGS
jgi:predicted ArsR family transcriptional regulator